MAIYTKEDWQAWNDERKRYLNRDTEGFSADIIALDKHIKALIEAAPKDSAGWLFSNCLVVIDKLMDDLNKAKIYLGQMP